MKICNNIISFVSKYRQLLHNLWFVASPRPYPNGKWGMQNIHKDPSKYLHMKNCISASNASELNGGLELLPKPSRSTAYTGRDVEMESKFITHTPMPHGKPCTNTRGVSPEFLFRETVRMKLSVFPQNLPMFTNSAS